MKLIKPEGEAPTEIEKQVAAALANLSEVPDLHEQLKELYFVGAKVCFLLFNNNFIFKSIYL